ncbi:NAD(P)/FAD-dependent oxidoreductase [Salirhabdus sp. Marseille-P4669]|uniref:NAD(P)/FAD-dependent oxidoreductase n=1 Tax=Salirhabdus sp. Marseille-P4669 TaxID=2042310 RepID=UPI000C7E5B89|nr:NAD(P)/FAD-dependent oxidoreductase [Salirhabdus sp. Marseille-P4669]
MIYDCIIIGGGFAGIQAAIQLGRYKHRVLVIDADFGRSTICRSYHNILGYPDGVSGLELRQIGKKQAEVLGVQFHIDKVEHINPNEETFQLTTKKGNRFSAKRLLLATGIMDRIPIFKQVEPTLGTSVYVCPDCDGYEVKDKKTIVMGSGDVGANMALTLTYWTTELTYINHEQKPISEDNCRKLAQHNIQYRTEPINEVQIEDNLFQGVTLESGEEIRGERGFVAFGGNKVESDLAKQLGVERLENKHIVTDPRTKMTNVKHVWAAGDVVAHSEQVTIALGEGSQAAIWIHKSLQ